ncbi:glycosyl hydrolase family 28-related protein [Spirilliplanes yamanashiensis]|uniref:Mycodextranase n=1 Tax=Spirilliplanes yamanashiensis TaxID=42233 RepID=A0A8J3Y8G6_9ACTN|nr:glycosyl hydrolase family 28-related protein [Spirilliplanes yamanashiensis]MDP9816921.1 hypothetical protein [Spirilliplanes yamanashiensis]GIJ03424.1 mycodextranase [Spirilliplanes yamanashiensis]
MSHRRRAGLAGLLAAALAATALTVSAWSAAPPRASAGSAGTVAGRGAAVPFVEHEAEDAATTGTVLAPGRRYGTLAAEASGRRAVVLDAPGEYVEFTLTAPADAVTVRYSIPDSADGRGRDGALLARAGTSVTTLDLTSRYGWFYGPHPHTNVPADGTPHHFYDETRALLGAVHPAGATVRLEAAGTPVTVDLADFELAGDPLPKPPGALDVVADFGADPAGRAEATARFQAAVDAGRAQGRPVYVPAGRYLLHDHVVVDDVTLQGAGPWHTVLGGRHPTDRARAAGVFGRFAADGAASRGVTVRDLAIIGEITERVDDAPVGAIGGSLTDSVVANVWLQHTKVGVWLDGPADNFTLRDSRILDQTADGVNFHRGVTNSAVTNTFVRNTGDDGLAMWAQDLPNAGNAFTRNTVVAPILANNIAVYGGRDITVADNVVADTVTNGGGIHVGNRYPGVRGPTAVAGTVTLARNTLLRAGAGDRNWDFGVGALWFDGLNEPIAGATIDVTDTDIVDSSYAAVHVVEGAVTGLRLTRVRIDGAGTYAVQLQAPGAATFTGVTATRVAQAATPVHRCGTGFVLSGVDWPSVCGPWPAPVW